MRFMAMAMFSWASLEMLPKDMAPLAKRLTISAAGSTSSRGTGAPPGTRSHSPRRAVGHSPWSFMSRANSA